MYSIIPNPKKVFPRSVNVTDYECVRILPGYKAYFEQKRVTLDFRSMGELLQTAMDYYLDNVGNEVSKPLNIRKPECCEGFVVRFRCSDHFNQQKDLILNKGWDLSRTATLSILVYIEARKNGIISK